MKKNLRLIAALLLTALLTALTAACGGDTPPVSGTTAPSDDVLTETTAEATAFTYKPLLEERDLEGFVMTVFQRSEAGSASFYEPGFYMAEQTGDVVRDEVYLRNTRLFERYNFSIEDISDISGLTELDAKFKSMVLAGDDTYDVIVIGPCYFNAYITNDMVVELSSLDNFHFDQPWWYDKLNDGLTIDHRLYMTVGAHMLNTKNGLYMLTYNKKLADDYGIGKNELYDAVEAGSWTTEKFLAAVDRVPSKDLNGDSVIDHNDLWSFGTENYGSFTLPLGAGFRIAEKDKDDIPYISFLSDKNMEIIDSYMKLYADTTKCIVTQTIPGVESVWTTASDMWLNDQMFMRMTSLVTNMRTMESDYGILPIPKFTEAQEDYCHTASMWNSPLMGIPVTCSDIGKTSYINEILACESLNGLTDVFYDNFLTTKLVRDEESIEMLKIIHDSMYFDIGSVFNWGSLISQLYNLTSTRTNNLASSVASLQSKAEAELAKSIEAVLG